MHFVPYSAVHAYLSGIVDFCLSCDILSFSLNLFHENVNMISVLRTRWFLTLPLVEPYPLILMRSVHWSAVSAVERNVD